MEGDLFKIEGTDSRPALDLSALDRKKRVIRTSSDGSDSGARQKIDKRLQFLKKVDTEVLEASSNESKYDELNQYNSVLTAQLGVGGGNNRGAANAEIKKETGSHRNTFRIDKGGEGMNMVGEERNRGNSKKAKNQGEKKRKSKYGREQIHQLTFREEAKGSQRIKKEEGGGKGEASQSNNYFSAQSGHSKNSVPFGKKSKSRSDSKKKKSANAKFVGRFDFIRKQGSGKRGTVEESKTFKVDRVIGERLKSHLRMGLPFHMDIWTKGICGSIKTPDISRLATMVITKGCEKSRERKNSPANRLNSASSPFNRSQHYKKSKRTIHDHRGRSKLKCLVKSVEEVNGKTRTRSTM